METLLEFSARASAYPEVFTSIPEKAERYMVLVEPRRYDLIEHVLRWALLHTLLGSRVQRDMPLFPTRTPDRSFTALTTVIRILAGGSFPSAPPRPIYTWYSGVKRFLSIEADASAGLVPPTISLYVLTYAVCFRNFVFYLAPKGWGLVICHGPDNAAYVRRVVRGRAGS